MASNLAAYSSDDEEIAVPDLRPLLENLLRATTELDQHNPVEAIILANLLEDAANRLLDGGETLVARHLDAYNALLPPDLPDDADPMDYLKRGQA